MSKKVLIIITAVFLIALVIGAYLLWSTYQSDMNHSTTTRDKNCTTYNGAIEEQCAEDYIGLTREEATTKAKNAGLVPKINKIDGEGQLNTQEGSTPIYFDVEDNVVSKAYFAHDVPAYEN